MRLHLTLLAVAAVIPAGAHAGSQSSNTSSNSSSNNGVVRERIVDTYCEDGHCDRYVERRVYRTDRQRRYRNGDWRRSYYYDYRPRRDRDDD